MLKYKNNKGMTLIELFVLLAILTVTAYVSFLYYKPRSKLTQLDYTVSELQNLILAMKAYQTVNGTWPDSENACADPISVLSAINDSGSPTYADVSDFVFMTQMTFQCEPNNTTATLYFDFEILKTDLEYYSRYVHDLEIIEDSDNRILKVRTSIRPVGGKLNTYLTQAKYGPFQRENEDGTFDEIDLATKYAFIEVPEECKGKEDITTGFSSQSLCTGVDVGDRRVVHETRLAIVAIDDEGIEHRMGGRVDIVRTFLIEGWDYSSDKCKYRNNGLNCNSNDQELVGWRVMPIPQSKIEYSVEYYFSKTSFFENFQIIDTSYYDSRVFSNESRIEDNIFANSSLVAVFRQAISSEVERRTNKDFSPRVSRSYWSDEDPNTYFTVYKF